MSKWAWPGVLLFGIGCAFLAFGMSSGGANPVEKAKDIAFSPAPGEVAMSLCKKPETKITLVRSPSNPYFEALYATAELRYDLTWQIDGGSVAVERTKGRDFDVWAEQIDASFHDCIKARSAEIVEKQVAH
jgi:hypothetical protein